MKHEQLDHALAIHQKLSALKARRDSIRCRTRPQGPSAVPQTIGPEGNFMTFNMGQTPLVLHVPEHMAQKFLEELDRYYDGELLSLEREFERL